MNNNLKIIWSSAVAALTSGIFVAAITIGAELNAPLKDWLKSLTGHHWITKSLSSIALYLVLLFLFAFLAREKTETQTRRALWWLIAISTLSALAILFFFVWHYLYT